jgi:hypothetical protein
MTSPDVGRTGPSEAIGGLLASTAILFALLGLAYRPVRVVPVAVILALVAAGMSGRNQRLPAIAAATGAVCFVLGLTIAILAGKPLY